MKKHPEYTYSVLRELERRNGLKTAIGGRTEKELAPLLQFFHRHITDPRFSNFLIRVVDMTIGKIFIFTILPKQADNVE